jgi:hypothetical protein
MARVQTLHSALAVRKQKVIFRGGSVNPASVMIPAFTAGTRATIVHSPGRKIRRIS